jgi:hypothetical protein
VRNFSGLLPNRVALAYGIWPYHVRAEVTALEISSGMKVQSLLIRCFIAFSVAISGCGGGSYSQGQPGGTQFPADVSGTYTFTLTGTNGSLTLHGTLKETTWTPCNGNLLCNGATYENNLNGNFSFSWCNADAFTATGQLFFTPGSAETFAFAIFDGTASSNLLTMSSSDFSKLSGTWQTGTAYTCAPIPSGTLNWTAVKN